MGLRFDEREIANKGLTSSKGIPAVEEDAVDSSPRSTGHRGAKKKVRGVRFKKNNWQ